MASVKSVVMRLAVFACGVYITHSFNTIASFGGPRCHGFSTNVDRECYRDVEGSVEGGVEGSIRGHGHGSRLRLLASSESNGYGDVGLLPSHQRYKEEGRLINAEEGRLILSREGEPQSGEISNEQLLKILEFDVNANMCTDLEVNTILWKCLGYRFVDREWNNEMCFPNWREKYPSPPDFIGMQRIYSKEVDNHSLKANQALCKTIPVHAKQSLKDNLRSYGFTGFKLADLTPNKTRRAQSCNWLLYYRDNLFGKTIEDLIKEKEARLEKEEEERRKREEEGGEEPWSPPVNPVV